MKNKILKKIIHLMKGREVTQVRDRELEQLQRRLANAKIAELLFLSGRFY